MYSFMSRRITCTSLFKHHLAIFFLESSRSNSIRNGYDLYGTAMEILLTHSHIPYPVRFISSHGDKEFRKFGQVCASFLANRDADHVPNPETTEQPSRLSCYSTVLASSPANDPYIEPSLPISKTHACWTTIPLQSYSPRWTLPRSPLIQTSSASSSLAKFA